MSTVAKKVIMGSGAVDAYEIEQSLIFDETASLVRTPSSTGNRKKWTISVWVKRAKLGAIQYIYGGQSTNETDLRFSGTDTIEYFGYQSGAHTWGWSTARKFRDVGAWYHIVAIFDSANSNQALRARLFVNGEEQSENGATSTAVPLNQDSMMNLADTPQYIGRLFSTGSPYYYSGYMAEFHFLDGAATVASNFGETDSATGQWIPKEYEGGSYGTNGFYQKYEKGAAADTPFLFEGDFTIEMFFKLTSMQVTGGKSYPVLLWLPPHNGATPDGAAGYKLQIDNNTNGYNLLIYSNEPDVFTIETGSGANAVALNTWYHVALVREGMGANNVSLYTNGTRRSQITYTNPVGSIGSTAYIGASGRNYGNWGGYINNVRIVKGTAVYSGSSHTVPTSNLTAISGTSLLALQGSGITDRLPATAPTLATYDTGGGGYAPIIQSNISGTVGTYTGLFYKDGYGDGNGGGISFNVPSAMGKDSSGNNNDYTPVSLLSTDVVIDTPTNNFATLNPLYTGSVSNTFSEGNLKIVTPSTGYGTSTATIVPTSGKYYAEFKGTTNGDSGNYGVRDVSMAATNSTWLPDGSTKNMAYVYTGNIYYNGSSVLSSAPATFGTDDVIAVAIDYDNSTVKWYKNNSLQYTATSADLENVTFAAGDSGNSAGVTAEANFGQKTFAYTPPSGYVGLSTANLPDPAIPLPSAHFNTVLYTGNAGTQDISGVGFQPDFLWIKRRDSSASHNLRNSITGPLKHLQSDGTGAEDTESTGVTAFLNDGFRLNGENSQSGQVNVNSGTFVAWNWKANGAGSTDTSGDIDAVVSANQASGFSIVTFTGNGSNDDTVPHGLGVAPEMVIYKRRNNGASNWVNWVTVIDGGDDYLSLNTTGAAASLSGVGSITSSFISNAAYGSEPMLAYCFASKPGFSKIGVYTGNGSADGAFVNCGFKPAWIMTKRTDAVNDWDIVDAKRNPFNPAGNPRLQPHTSAAELTNTPNMVDLLSNGFKIRQADGFINANNGVYLYMAFAESPFKTVNAR